VQLANLDITGEFDRFRAGAVDTANVTAGSTGSLDVVRWLNGQVTVTDVKSIKTKGDRRDNIEGNFGPNLTVNATGNSEARNAVGSARIKGALTGAWTVTGLADARKDSAAGKVSADNIGPNYTAIFDGDVGRIDSKGDISGDITANIIDRLSARENATDLTLTLLQPVIPDDDRTEALGRYDVRGTSTNVMINSAGHIGSFKTSVLIDSDIYAGVDLDVSGLLTSADQLIANALIDKIDVRGDRDAPFALINSNFGASRLGKATLGVINDGNGGVLFGLASTTFDTISIDRDRIAPQDVPGLTFDGDFRIVLL